MDGVTLGILGAVAGGVATIVVAYINGRLQGRQILASETEAVIDILRSDYDRVVAERDHYRTRLLECMGLLVP